MSREYLRRRGNGGRKLGSGIAVVTFIASIALAVLSLTYVQQRDFVSAVQQQLRPRSGNTSVASDIYGLGVRVGVYTQVLGMLFSIASKRIAGIRLAVSGMTIGLMASWTVLAARKTISPCESLVILALNSALTIVDSIVSGPPKPDSEHAQSGGSLWVFVANFWFWSTLVFQLPLLDTQNETWIFTRVRLDGGYRIFVLVILGIVTFLLLAALIAGSLAVALNWTTIKLAFKNRPKSPPAQAQAHKDDSAEDESEGFKHVSTWYLAKRAISGGTSLVFIIATIEMTIIYNGLQPETNLSLPGQTIPFTIGLVALLDGLVSVAVKCWKSFRGNDEDDEEGHGDSLELSSQP